MQEPFIMGRMPRLPVDRVFIFTVVVLAPLTAVKIAGAEPINFASVAFFAMALMIARHQHAKISLLLPRRLVSLASSWLLFIGLATISGLCLDLYLTFYIPHDASLVQIP